VLPAGKNSVNFFCKFFIGTQLLIYVGIYRKQQILTEYRKIFCLFLLVGLSPGGKLSFDPTSILTSFSLGQESYNLGKVNVSERVYNNNLISLLLSPVILTTELICSSFDLYIDELCIHLYFLLIFFYLIPTL
jgi:hypothetical protein